MAMIFDVLWRETGIRKDQVAAKLSELGWKLPLDDILNFRLFV